MGGKQGSTCSEARMHGGRERRKKRNGVHLNVGS